MDEAQMTHRYEQLSRRHDLFIEIGVPGRAPACGVVQACQTTEPATARPAAAVA
jgi:hypothetical protein